MIGSRGQRKAVLEHLRKYGSLTSMDAFKYFGVTRLSAVIFDLRKAGHDIETVWEETENRYDEHCRFGRYYLHETNPAEVKK